MQSGWYQEETVQSQDAESEDGRNRALSDALALEHASANVVEFDGILWASLG